MIGAIFSDYAALVRVYFYSGKDRYIYIEKVADDVYKFLPESMRLEYLIDYNIPMTFSPPEGNELVLREVASFRYFRDQDWELLKKHKEKVIPILMEKLKKRDHSVALMLGYLKAKKALPLLREAFIKDDYFYGWEGSAVSDANNYTHHYCYEEAIEYITGMPIEKYIKLSPEELKNLGRRKAKGEEAAAYVLYRLAGESWQEIGRSPREGR